MLKRSHCGAVRMRLELGKPSVEILRAEALSLWRRANASCSRQTLCGDPARRSALAVSVFRFFGLSLLANRCWEVVSWFTRLLSRSRISTRSALAQVPHDTVRLPQPRG